MPLMLPFEKDDQGPVVAEVKRQRAEILSCCPSLTEADGSEGLNRRGSLLWAEACIRSRVVGSSDRFQWVPFIDMLNHAAAPNAEVSLMAEKEPLDDVPSGFVELFAKRNID